MYCNKNIDILKRVVSILEKQNELDNERGADEQWALHMAEYEDYQSMHAARMAQLAREEQNAHWDYIDFDNDLPHRIFRSVSI
tara:strand:+ start:378 stop:626 length:249 start_codon:yes stop_codon:yes gene_type:complete